MLYMEFNLSVAYLHGKGDFSGKNTYWIIIQFKVIHHIDFSKQIVKS